MFHFTLAKIVEVRVPARERREIFGHVFRQKNVTGIAAIHHPLRHVNARPGNVGTIAHIDHFIDRPAVNPHPQPDVGMVFNAAAISIAHSIGACGSSKNTRLIPSPVGMRTSYP